MIYIGFDFSINKPACTILYKLREEDDFYKIKMFFWGLSLPTKTLKLMEDCDILVRDRGLDSVKRREYKGRNTELVREHTKRSTELAKMIVKDILDFILYELTIKENIITDIKEVKIASEGLSFSSNGNSSIDLATYKGVLLSELSKVFPLDNIYTYPPTTLKRVAQCNREPYLHDKNAIINSFIDNEGLHLGEENKLYNALKSGEFKNSVNYMKGVDDLVDSYFCAKALVWDLEGRLEVQKKSKKKKKNDLVEEKENV